LAESQVDRAKEFWDLWFGPGPGKFPVTISLCRDKNQRGVGFPCQCQNSFLGYCEWPTRAIYRDTGRLLKILPFNCFDQL
jgi:hypothetical protein